MVDQSISKDKNPRKRKEHNKRVSTFEIINTPAKNLMLKQAVDIND